LVFHRFLIDFPSELLREVVIVLLFAGVRFRFEIIGALSMLSRCSHSFSHFALIPLISLVSFSGRIGTMDRLHLLNTLVACFVTMGPVLSVFSCDFQSKNAEFAPFIRHFDNK